MGKISKTIVGWKNYCIASPYGSVPVGNQLRDFHFPGAIPVGGSNDVFRTIDYHAKESRFNLGTQTKIDGHELKSFVEMDFLQTKRRR